MPSLIDLRRRIRAVKNTQQITKAMKMVAASKLRRAQERIVNARPYASEIHRVLTSVLLAAFGSRTVSSGWIDGSTLDATLPSTRCICDAYGRALMIRSCERRSFDAATIFIAFVICCVDFTARMRRRMSMSDGTYDSLR